MKQNHQQNLDALRSVIAGHGSMTVAYSGGVDSSLLAYVAYTVLGNKMMCVIGISPSLAERERDEALAFLELHNIPYQTITTHEMDNPSYRENSVRRCFFCKDELFSRIESSAEAKRFGRMAYGANTDDHFDHRPGAKAADDHEVVAPLAEANLNKEAVRACARDLGLKLWDKPAAPCLASRIPYHTEVTPERLKTVELAEQVLHDLGFKECRVRYYRDEGDSDESGGEGKVEARVEIPLSDHVRVRLPETWDTIVKGIRAAGFSHVVLEEDGLRSGRLNDVLKSS